ncbi:MAG: nicotinamide-nucleotide amidohydrolase family protein, partial [Pedobacter sp.]
MMYLMQDEILPRLKNAYKLPFIVHKTILTANIGESFLATEIESIENNLPPHIKLAYLPKLGQVRLRLSATGEDEQLLLNEVESSAQLIIDKIRPYVVAENDIALEKAVLDVMEDKGLTLSTAESCTGGYIAHLITKHPGSSLVYKGGAVVYSNDLKRSILSVSKFTLDSYGAVSEQTVREMAKGALDHFKTDYSVSVSGIAGPGGDTPDKPVGTVWIAVASKRGIVSKLFKFGNKRVQNIERSASAALMMILNELKRNTV